jgi:hypothetical protein
LHVFQIHHVLFSVLLWKYIEQLFSLVCLTFFDFII